MTRRIFMLGASGTIGQATVRALVARGHEVVCFVRPQAGVGGALGPQELARRLPGAELRFGEVTNPSSLARDGFAGERFDVLMSCLASRTGAPGDAWAIDHQAHVQALDLAQRSGVTQMVMLSAICVQKPLLAFQQAKLAFADRLRGEPLHRAAHGLLQVPVWAGGEGAAGQALRGVRRRQAHRLQTHQRRRPGRLPGRLRR
jgi:divinyl chlorophyllide a 8-vinyl-reductase